MKPEIERAIHDEIANAVEASLDRALDAEVEMSIAEALASQFRESQKELQAERKKLGDLGAQLDKLNSEIRDAERRASEAVAAMKVAETRAATLASRDEAAERAQIVAAVKDAVASIKISPPATVTQVVKAAEKNVEWEHSPVMNRDGKVIRVVSKRKTMQ